MLLQVLRVLVVTILISPLARADTTSDLQAIGEWSSKFQVVYLSAMTVSEHSDAATDLGESWFAGDIATNEASTRLKEISGAFEAFRHQTELDIASLGHPPLAPTVKKQAKMLVGNLEFLIQIFKEGADFAATSIELTATALAASDEVILTDLENQLSARGYQSTILALQGENHLLEENISAQDKNHPQSYITRASLTCNESFIAVFKALMDFQLGDPDTDLMLSRLEIVKENRKRTNKTTKTGLKKRDRMAKQFSRRANASAEELKIFAVLDQMFMTYDESFKVEDTIALEMVNFLELMNSAQSDPDESTSDEAFETWGNNVDALISRRLTLHQERVTALAKIQ